MSPVKPARPELDAAQADLRHARRRRNVERVVAALIDLWMAGELRPSAADVAERAGLSQRSLFRYFEDMPALQAEALRQQAAREAAAGLFELPRVEGDLCRRIEVFVGLRLWQYERLSPMARVSFLHAPFSEAVRAAIAERRTLLRAQLEHVFAPELARFSPARRRHLLHAAEVATAFEALEMLRRERRLPERDVRAVLELSLRALFGEARRA